MPRRFTVTEKWTQDKWFMELDAPSKLMFIYLYENCDCAGFWEINIKEAAYRIALNEETVYQAFKDVEKCYVRDDRFCAIVSFLHHQRNLPLNPENKAHIGILNRLISHPGLYEALKIRWESKGYIHSERTLFNQENQAPSKPLPRGYGKGNGIGKEKCLDKNNEKFDQFWKTYPKKVGKGPARKAFVKIKPSEELLQKMLAAVEQQSKSEQWLQEGGRFIPNPATWLNQERWDDEVSIKGGQHEPNKISREFTADSKTQAGTRSQGSKQPRRNLARDVPKSAYGTEIETDTMQPMPENQTARTV